MSNELYDIFIYINFKNESILKFILKFIYLF